MGTLEKILTESSLASGGREASVFYIFIYMLYNTIIYCPIVQNNIIYTNPKPLNCTFDTSYPLT